MNQSLGLNTVLLNKLIFSYIHRKADLPINILSCGICSHSHNDLLSRCPCVPKMKLTLDKLDILLELFCVPSLDSPVCILQFSWWFQSKPEKKNLSLHIASCPWGLSTKSCKKTILSLAFHTWPKSGYICCWCFSWTLSSLAEFILYSPLGELCNLNP